MFRRFAQWFQSWLAMRRVFKAHRMATRLEKRFKAASNRLILLRRKQEALMGSISTLAREVAEELSRVEEMRSNWEESIEELRRENQIMSELVIPDLVASHRAILERYDTLAAVEVRNRTLLTPGNEQ